MIQASAGESQNRRDGFGRPEKTFIALLQRDFAMTGEEAAGLASCCAIRTLREGDILVREGERATAVDWIVAGSAFVSRFSQRDGRLALVDLSAGDVVGEMAYLRRDPDAVYSATVQAREGAIVASTAFAALRDNPALDRARVKLVERFGQIAAERLNATSGMTVDAISTGRWRERRLALHLGAINAVLALFVVLSNSMDVIRRLAPSEMSQASFLSVFHISLDTALAFLFYLLLRALKEPPRSLGLALSDWRRQVRQGLGWSVPALAAAAAIRSWLHPDEGLFSVYALGGGSNLLSAAGIGALLAYVVYLCPIQEYVARAGVQAPIMNAFGGTFARVGAVVSTLVAAIAFGAMHILFGVSAVLLTTCVGLYWGIMFVWTRSVLAVTVSHMVLGVAAFYWFGLIR